MRRSRSKPQRPSKSEGGGEAGGFVMGAPIRDPDIGTVEQRVYALEQGFRDVRADIHAQKAEFSQQITGVKADFSQQLTGVATSLREAITSLSAKMDERSRPQWQLYVTFAGFLLTFTTVVGTLAYWPIRDDTNELKTAVARFEERAVTRAELADRRAVLEDRIKRIEADLNVAERSIVPRPEHEEKWRSFDREGAALQRQIDDMKKQFGDTFSLRDALLQMQRRLDAIEAERRAGRS